MVNSVVKFRNLNLIVGENQRNEIYERIEEEKSFRNKILKSKILKIEVLNLKSEKIENIRG